MADEDGRGKDRTERFMGRHMNERRIAVMLIVYYGVRKKRLEAQMGPSHRH